ncbi:MAG: uracil-DNA glycosylase, partial [Pararhodobacter sp.]|nr:uracil-DNA glycosylase [Pararhodobacter sp.]
MTMAIDWHLARALLEWQVELGVTDAVLTDPVDRFARADAIDETLPETASVPAASPPGTAQPAIPPAPMGADPVAEATRLAAAARDLP